MKVTVRLFAILRERANASELTLDLPDSATAESVREAIAKQFPAIANHLQRVAFAINRTYAPPTTSLHDGDEVALIPPVSGG